MPTKDQFCRRVNQTGQRVGKACEKYDGPDEDGCHMHRGMQLHPDWHVRGNQLCVVRQRGQSSRQYGQQIEALTQQMHSNERTHRQECASKDREIRDLNQVVTSLKQQRDDLTEASRKHDTLVKQLNSTISKRQQECADQVQASQRLREQNDDIRKKLKDLKSAENSEQIQLEAYKRQLESELAQLETDLANKTASFDNRKAQLEQRVAKWKSASDASDESVRKIREENEELVKKNEKYQQDCASKDRELKEGRDLYETACQSHRKVAVRLRDECAKKDVELQNLRSELTGKITKLEHDLTAKTSFLNSSIQELEELKQNVEVHEEKLAAKESELNDLGKAHEVLIKQMTSRHREECATKDSELQRLRDEKAVGQQQLKDLELSNTSVQNKLDDAMKKSSDEAKAAKKMRDELTDEIAKLNQAVADKNSIIQSINQAITGLNDDCEGLQQSIALLEEQVAAKETELNDFTQVTLINRGKHEELVKQIASKHQQECAMKDSDLQSLRDEKLVSQKQLEDLRLGITSVQSKLDDATKKSSDEAEAAKKMRDQLTDEIAELKTDLADKTANCAELVDECEGLEVRIASLAEHLAAKESELHDLTESRDALVEQMHKSDSKHQQESASKDLELVRIREDSQMQLNDLQQNNEALQHQLDDVIKQNSNEAEAISSMHTQLERLIAKLENVTVTVSELNQRNSSLEHQLAAKESELHELTAHHDTHDKVANELCRDLENQLTEKTRSLENATQQLEEKEIELENHAHAAVALSQIMQFGEPGSLEGETADENVNFSVVVSKIIDDLEKHELSVVHHNSIGGATPIACTKTKIKWWKKGFSWIIRKPSSKKANRAETCTVAQLQHALADLKHDQPIMITSLLSLNPFIAKSFQSTMPLSV